MIVDKIENHRSYHLPGELQTVAEYMATHDLTLLDPGNYRLPNGMLMCVDEYIPQQKKEPYYRGNEEKTQLRYLIEGSERLGYANKKEMTFVSLISDDQAIYAGEGGFLRIRPGTFVVLFPQDCYMLKLVDKEGIPVRNATVWWAENNSSSAGVTRGNGGEGFA